MDTPSIGLDVLEKYVQANRQFTLDVSGQEIQLHFFPNTPEAMQHFPDGQGVEHVMFGVIENGRVYFTVFLTRSGFGETKTELHGEDDPVMEWLKYI